MPGFGRKGKVRVGAKPIETLLEFVAGVARLPSSPHWRSGDSRYDVIRDLELLQEPQIAFPEFADVVDCVLEHRDALRAHAKGETANHFRVVAAVA